MLLAPFLWIFCEFDEKVLDNLSLAKPQNLSSSVWAFVWQHSICRPSPS